MNYFTTDTDLTAVADAIRQRGGTSSPLVYPNGFVTAIQNIPGGGGGGPTPSSFDIDTTGMNILYQNSNLTFDGTNYVDTGVKLFSAENINKDFKIVFRDILSNTSLGTGSASERTFFACKYEVSPYPGIAMRTGTNTLGSGRFYIANNALFDCVYVERKNGIISGGFAAYRDNYLTGSSSAQNTSFSSVSYGIGSMASANAQHDMNLVLGAALDSNGSPFRYCGGSIGSIVVAIAN